MRTSLTLTLLLAAAHPAAAQDPLPLRPGSVGIVLDENSSVTVEGDGSRDMDVRKVTRGSPAARAGIRPDMVVLAVDGRSFRPGMSQRASLALAGPIGTPVEVTVRALQGDDTLPRTVRLVREDVLGPEPGYTEAVVTPHFVVHHRPGEKSRRVAVRQGRRAERQYAHSWGDVRGTGRRGHLYLVEPRLQDAPASSETPPFVGWVGYPESQWDVDDVGRWEVGPVGSYVALGLAGPAGMSLGTLGSYWPMRLSAEMHHGAGLALLSPSPAPPGEDRALWTARWAGLAAYVHERYGLERLRVLWRADEEFDRAVPRVLGVSREQLLEDWRRHVLTVGPDPERGPGLAGTAAVLGWGALVLLAGAWIARRKEAG